MSKEGMHGGSVGPFSYFSSLTMKEERTIEETRRHILLATVLTQLLQNLMSASQKVDATLMEGRPRALCLCVREALRLPL